MTTTSKKNAHRSLRKGTNSLGSINIAKIVSILICVAFIIAIRLWRLTDLHAPYVYDDEMGYLTHAANLAGKSWIQTTDTWYSFGYSILLAPLFLVFDSITEIFRAIIVLNALCGVLQFAISIKILEAINDEFRSKHWFTAHIISLVSANTSVALFQSQMGWCETVLYTFTLLFFFALIKFVRIPSIKNSVITCGLLVYIYIVHNRSIVFFVAFAITILLMVLLRQISWKSLLTSALVIVLLLSGYNLLEKHLRAKIFTDMQVAIYEFDGSESTGEVVTEIPALEYEELVSSRIEEILTSTDMAASASLANYEEDEVSSSEDNDDDIDIENFIEDSAREAIENNNPDRKSGVHTAPSFDEMDTMVSKLIRVLTNIRPFGKFMMSTLNKAWAFFSETFLISLLGVFFLIKKVTIGIFNRKNSKATDTYNWHFYLFCLLTIIGTLLVTGLRMMPGIYRDPSEIDQTVLQRIDPYFYCRYSDALCGIFVLFGMVEIINLISYVREKGLKSLLYLEFLVGGALYAFCGLVLDYQLAVYNMDTSFVVMPNVPGLQFFERFSVSKISSCNLVCWAILFAVILASGLISRHTKTSRLASSVVTCVVGICVLLASIFVANNAITRDIIPNQNENLKYLEIHDLVEKITSNEALASNTTVHLDLTGDYFARQRIRVGILDLDTTYYPSASENILFITNDPEDMLYSDAQVIDVYCGNPSISVYAVGTDLNEFLSR